MRANDVKLSDVGLASVSDSGCGGAVLAVDGRLVAMFRMHKMTNVGLSKCQGLSCPVVLLGDNYS